HGRNWLARIFTATAALADEPVLGQRHYLSNLELMAFAPLDNSGPAAQPLVLRLISSLAGARNVPLQLVLSQRRMQGLVANSVSYLGQLQSAFQLGSSGSPQPRFSLCAGCFMDAGCRR